MKSKFLAVFALLAGSSLYAAPRVAIGFGVNLGPAYVAPAYVAPAYGYYAPVAPPPPPPVVTYYRPPVVRYYAPRPVYGGYWVAPRVYRGRYYGRYWRR